MLWNDFLIVDACYTVQQFLLLGIHEFCLLFDIPCVNRDDIAAGVASGLYLFKGLELLAAIVQN